jgi:hypothetical protein
VKPALAMFVTAALAMPAAAANPYTDALARLSPAQRAAALRRAVIDNGHRCGRVEDVGTVPAFKNLLGWHARCTPGGDFLAFVGPDGSVQVRTCEDARKLNIPGCPAVRK